MKKILFATLAAITLMAAECNPDAIVLIQVTDITFTTTPPAVMEIGQTVTLTVDILPVDATNQSVNWSSDDESIAIVSSTGKVTAIGVGSTFLHATATDGSNVANSCIVVVIFSAVGDGTSIDPYVITTPAQLNAINGDLDASYELGGNIDLTEYIAAGRAVSTKGGSEGWTPIGNAANPFKGSFDGAGYKIIGLTINLPETQGVGLFGFIESATISNLGLESVNITGKSCVGGIAGGDWINGSSITNCYVTGLVKGTTGTVEHTNVGGLIGTTASYGTSITSCYTTCVVSGESRVGGVVGNLGPHSNLSNCYATGAVSGDHFIGGVVGLTYAAMSYCYASGVVSGRYAVGGVAGNTTGASEISFCVALNPSVTVTENPVGRVTCYVPATSTLSHNWARADMTVTYNNGTDKDPLEKGHDQLDGADCDAIPGSSWWAMTALNGPDWYGVNLWIFAPGQLPKLFWQL